MAILAELSKRGLLIKGQKAPTETVEKKAKREAAEERRRRQRIALARDIWRSSHPATATSQVPQYLASRGIALEIPQSIRVQGALGPYGRHPSGERRPQMIALVEHIDLGAVAISRTFLAIDGSGKAALDPVRMFCGPVAGAVRLAPAAERLAITEGVETGLAFMLGSGLATWAALSAAGIRNLLLPEVVREIVIAADPDAVGTIAARAAARRWRAEGRRVVIARPTATDRDFNDLLMMI
jgi:putative DNA primase/helicase